MTIGERIKKIRTSYGLSTYNLSQMTGISQSTISKLENGKRKADSEILEKIALALNVSVDRLSGESVSSIIENRLDELNISLEDVARKANVPFEWLQDIDSFIPSEADDQNEFFQGKYQELNWDDVIGCSTSYTLISRVADVLGIPGGILRAALARQEIPLPNDLPRITAKEAFNESISKETLTNNTPPDLAAHFDGDEYTEEELEEIRKFAEFVKSKRK